MANKTAPSARSASRRLMIVENQHEISRLLESTLEKLAGALEVIHAPSGEEAFLYSSFTRIDLLITDYHLPGLDGIELMHKLRKKQPDVRVILVCRGSDPAARQAVSAAGADAFFIKPIQLVDFLASIEQLLALTLPGPVPVQALPVEQEYPPLTLSGLLADLRQQLKSQALLLINSNGEVMARAGDLPDMDVELALLSSLLSIQSAGGKVSHLLGQDDLSSWSVFDRGKYDLVFVPLGEEHALFALGQNLAVEKQLMKTVVALRLSRTPILSLIYENIEPLPSQGTQPGQETSQPSNGDLRNGKLESFLDKLEKVPQSGEADEFWNAAVRKQITPLNPDTLSYDQARQLGLTPGEDS
jgi:DNA-binding response OmpR family regulator